MSEHEDMHDDERDERDDEFSGEDQGAMACRLSIRWNTQPSVGVVHAVAQTGGFDGSSRDLLQRVRSDGKLLSRPMTVAEARTVFEACPPLDATCAIQPSVGEELVLYVNGERGQDVSC